MEVQSFWQGDDRTAPSQSGVCDFTVKNLTPQFVLNQNSNCRSGPGMDYDVVTAWNKGDILDVEARSPDRILAVYSAAAHQMLGGDWTGSLNVVLKICLSAHLHPLRP